MQSFIERFFHTILNIVLRLTIRLLVAVYFCQTAVMYDCEPLLQAASEVMQIIFSCTS